MSSGWEDRKLQSERIAAIRSQLTAAGWPVVPHMVPNGFGYFCEDKDTIRVDTNPPLLLVYFPAPTQTIGK